VGRAIVEISFAEELMPVNARLDGMENRLEALETIRLSDRLAYSVKQAAILVGVSPSQFYKEISSGRLPAKNLGERKLIILRADLLAFLDNLPDANEF
jgi:excisionase family DNA binding protein